MIKICSYAKANKKADTCANKLRHDFCSFAKMLSHILIQSFAALSRFRDLLAYLLLYAKIELDTHTHPTTVIPAAHVHRDVIMIQSDFVYVARAKEFLSLNDAEHIKMYIFQFHSESTVV